MAFIDSSPGGRTNRATVSTGYLMVITRRVRMRFIRMRQQSPTPRPQFTTSTQVKERPAAFAPCGAMPLSRSSRQNAAPTVNTALASHWLFPPHSRA